MRCAACMHGQTHRGERYPCVQYDITSKADLTEFYIALVFFWRALFFYFFGVNSWNLDCAGYRAVDRDLFAFHIHKI